jgi:hypothetical protein
MVAGSAHAASPVKVRDVAGIKEWGGSAIDGWFAWQANTKAHPHIYKVYVQPDGGAVQQLALAGTSNIGDLIQTGRRSGRVVFQADLHDGDIRFYDPAADDVLRAPKGINTAKIEELPEADGDYLVFDRVGSSTRRTILYRFSTKTSTAIGQRMRPGQLNGDYVALWTCTQATCNVLRYRISEDRFTTMPAAGSGRANYWPAIMADGTVYYVQGNATKCGRNTKILSFHAGSVTTVLHVPER